MHDKTFKELAPERIFIELAFGWSNKRSFSGARPLNFIMAIWGIFWCYLMLHQSVTSQFYNFKKMKEQNIISPRRRDDRAAVIMNRYNLGKGHHISHPWVHERLISWVITVWPVTKDDFWWAWEALLQSLALINSASPAVISHQYPINQPSFISHRKCLFFSVFLQFVFQSYKILK